MSWPIGTLVLLVFDDCPLESPPVGAYGEVVSALDDDGDYEVLFPHHPCPVPPGEWWFIPASWLVRVGDKAAAERIEIVEGVAHG